MSTIRETILQALLAALETMPAATVLREEILPKRTPPAGLVILRDGDPGAPEVMLSPLSYSYEHKAELEVIVQGKTPTARATAFDSLVQEIGAVIAANRTLGGLCDWIEATAPKPVDLPIEGADALKVAIIEITLIYTTTDPLA
ncbi:MAG: acyl-CoA transferase [Alphaproteobacteria bacterium]|nr:acyl-CoA transferase [Alphaproteobacteria bacterium]